MDHPKDKHPYTTAASGRRVAARTFCSDDVRVHDVANALSNQCRYNGHVSRFYSVAEHSVLVSEELARRGESAYVQLCGLLHDAHEAYCGDMPSPFKDVVAGWHEFEDAFERTTRRAFGLDQRPWPAAVKDVDITLLHVEATEFFKPPPAWVDPKIAHEAGKHILPVGYAPRRAYDNFTTRLVELDRILGLENPALVKNLRKR